MMSQEYVIVRYVSEYIHNEITGGEQSDKSLLRILDWGEIVGGKRKALVGKQRSKSEWAGLQGKGEIFTSWGELLLLVEPVDSGDYSYSWASPNVGHSHCCGDGLCGIQRLCAIGGPNPSSLVRSGGFYARLQGLAGGVLRGLSSFIGNHGLLAQPTHRVLDSSADVCRTRSKTISSIIYPISGVDDFAHLRSAAFRILENDDALKNGNQSKHKREENYEPVMQPRFLLFENAPLPYSLYQIGLSGVGCILIFCGLGCFQFWLFYALKSGRGVHAIGSISCGFALLAAACYVIHTAVYLSF